MVLANITVQESDRTTEYRKRKKLHDEKLVTPGAVADYAPQGWIAAKPTKNGVRLRKQRTEAEILENRLWCCLYRLGYSELNVGRNFKIQTADGVQKQIDVFAKDDETVVVAECKTAEEHKKKPLQKDLGELHANKRSISTEIRRHYGRDFKPKIIWIFVTDNIALTQADLARAKEYRIDILTDRELTYFEEISKALGTAARQQFKAEYLSGLDIPALENKKIPAVKTRAR
jgi:DNA sulfur modification protein DndB